VLVVVLADESITITLEKSNEGEVVAVSIVGDGVFSTYVGTPETPSRTSDIKPSSIVLNPESGLTVFPRIASPFVRASHDDTHTKKIITEITAARKRAILFLI